MALLALASHTRDYPQFGYARGRCPVHDALLVEKHELVEEQKDPTRGLVDARHLRARSLDEMGPHSFKAVSRKCRQSAPSKVSLVQDSDDRASSLSLKSQRDLYECVETSSWDLSKDTLFNRKNSSGILNGPASSPRVPRSRLSWREWIFGGCVLRSRGPALDAKGPKGWASTSVSPRTRNSTELSTVAKGPRRSGRRS